MHWAKISGFTTGQKLDPRDKILYFLLRFKAPDKNYLFIGRKYDSI
jgi:hypothetical protein